MDKTSTIIGKALQGMLPENKFEVRDCDECIFITGRKPRAQYACDKVDFYIDIEKLDCDEVYDYIYDLAAPDFSIEDLACTIILLLECFEPDKSTPLYHSPIDPDNKWTSTTYVFYLR